MKKAVATFCLIGGALALSACDTTGSGERDTQPPYTMDRTASHGSEAAPAKTYSSPSRVAPAERVFQRAQTK